MGVLVSTKKRQHANISDQSKSTRKASQECIPLNVILNRQEFEREKLSADKHEDQSDVPVDENMSTKCTSPEEKPPGMLKKSNKENHKTAEGAEPTEPNVVGVNDINGKDTPSTEEVRNKNVSKPDGPYDETNAKTTEKLLSGVERKFDMKNDNYSHHTERSPSEADKSIKCDGKKSEEPSSQNGYKENSTGKLDDDGVCTTPVQNNLNKMITEEPKTGNTGVEGEDRMESVNLNQTDSKETDERKRKAENEANSISIKKIGIQNEKEKAKQISGQDGKEKEKVYSKDINNTDESITHITDTQDGKKTAKSEYLAGDGLTDSKQTRDADNNILIQEVGGASQDNPYKATEGTNVADVVSQSETQENTDGKPFQEIQDNKKDISNGAIKESEEEPTPTIYEHALSDNLRFYRNEILSRPFPGSRIEDMLEWKGDYTKLEFTHSYIQWLFPIPESSGMNFSAQALQEHEAKAIKEDKELRGRVLKAFEMMLDFYGMKLVDRDKRTFARADNFESRYEHLNRSIHNYFRITRILKALGELGLEDLQAPWLEFIIDEATIKKQLPRLNNSRTMDHWLDALIDKAEHVRLYQTLFNFNNNAGSEQNESSVQERTPKIDNQSSDTTSDDTAAGKEDTESSIETTEATKTEVETLKGNKCDETVAGVQEIDVQKLGEDTDGGHSHSEEKSANGKDPEETFESKIMYASSIRNCHRPNDHPTTDLEKDEHVGDTGGMTERVCCDSGRITVDENVKSCPEQSDKAENEGGSAKEITDSKKQKVSHL